VRNVFSMTLSHVLALALVACFAVACGEGEPAEPSSAPSQPSSAAAAGSPGPSASSSSSSSSSSPSPPPAPPSLTAQAAAGQPLFQEHCAGCHGGSVSVAGFETAADLLDYVGTNMPRNTPGSLMQSEYLSIVAFDLAEKGIDLHGQNLDAANAGSVSLR
jgi:hypothetical protein